MVRIGSRRFPPISGGSALLRLSLGPIWRRFEKAARDPETAQRALWAEIARECQDSPFWRKRWGRGGAPPLTELPITEYSDYKSTFEAAFEEGFSPTTAAPVGYWAVSSGTTAATPKRFPYIAGNAKQRLASFGPFGAYLYRQSVVEPRIPFAPALVLANAGSHEPSPSGVPVGFATGYFLTKTPTFARRAFSLPWPIYERPDLWNEWAPLYAVARDVSLAAGVSAAWVVKFYESLLDRMESYWPYLEGRAQPPPPLPRIALSRRRLHHLREVFRGGKPTMRDVWPRLAAVLCWTSASSAAQVPMIEPWLGGVALRDYLYVCTEAAMTVPLYDEPECGGHPLHPGAAIVELLPMEAEPVARNLLPAWRAEPGRSYEVFLTTLNGMIRYRLHDIVRCTGWYHRSPRLAFRSKTEFVLKVSHTVIPEDEVIRLLRKIGYRGRDDLLVGPHPFKSAFAMYVRQGSVYGGLGESLERELLAVSEAYALERGKGILSPVVTISVPASHAMWDYQNRIQAKSRCILPEAPAGLATAGGA